jgi:hypothetical protein
VRQLRVEPGTWRALSFIGLPSARLVKGRSAGGQRRLITPTRIAYIRPECKGKKDLERQRMVMTNKPLRRTFSFPHDRAIIDQFAGKLVHVPDIIRPNSDSTAAVRYANASCSRGFQEEFGMVRLSIENH